jgi:hypothetical protein
MIRFILIFLVALGTLVLTGARYKNGHGKTFKKYCKGYTVIEVDKGIDCYGDTIKLVKVNGFFERDV